MRRIGFFIAIFLFLLASTLGCRQISRGLDSSSTVFVVQVKADQKDIVTSVERTSRVIQSRLDATGVTGEVKQSEASPDRLEVKIFGKNDIAKLKDFLFKTYKLEYRKLISPPSPSPAQTFPTEEQAKIAATEGQEALPFSEREESDTWQYVLVEKAPVITGEHIRHASAVSRTNSDVDYQISFSLNEQGADKFSDWTGKNINNYLAVVLDGKVKSIAFIRSVISDQGEISGSFSKAHAEEIALILNSGYMPWELNIVEERQF